MALRRKQFYSVYPTNNNTVGKEFKDTVLAPDAKYLIF